METKNLKLKDPNSEDDAFLANTTQDQEPIVLPIDGILDLHTFSPKEVGDLLEDYVAECLKMGIYDLRIIHGKGKGILRDRVRRILAKHPMVESVSEAPLEAGGWGATLVRLRRET
ncbi:MAG: Smr/MutS family protein [Desulfomonilaceae bacterium]